MNYYEDLDSTGAVITFADGTTAYLSDYLKDKADSNEMFWIVYRDMFDILDLLGKGKAAVVKEIVRSVSQKTNCVGINQALLAKNLGVTRQTVATVIVELEKHDFIRPRKPGVWMFNPMRMVKGGKSKRAAARQSYEELPYVSHSRKEETIDDVDAVD